MTEQDIRSSLIQQLKSKGADIAHFEALVDDYISYYRMVEIMKRDILENGLTYKAVSAAGNKYDKANPNVKLLPQYTKIMLSILKDLNLTTEKIEAEDEAL